MFSTEPSDESTLEAILDPISPEEFLSEYWGRKPLHIRGRADKFARLYSLEQLWACLRGVKSGYSADLRDFSVRATFDRGYSYISVQPQDASKLLDAGATICINKMNAVDARLNALVAQLKRETRYMGEIDFRAYISPDGHGFDTHFDARVATTLQMEGSKEWTYSKEPAADWPHYQVNPEELRSSKPPRAGLAWKHPSDCTFETVVLEPGDLLCLPAGCWHSAAARGYSFAFNLAFDPRGGFFTTFGPALKQLMMIHPGWRSALPPVYMPQAARDGAPEAVHDFYKTRINEMIGVLELLRDTPDVIDEAWKKLVTAGPSGTGESIG